MATALVVVLRTSAEGQIKLSTESLNDFFTSKTAMPMK